MNFSEFPLHEDLIKGIKEAGYNECMEVQEKSILPLLDRKDLLVQSQTGSGKTAAFLIPTLELNHRDKSKVLIIVPTRELATQIEEEAKVLAKYMPTLIGSFYGGVGYEKQENLLKNNVDFIIGTPGRLIDFGEKGKLNFSKIDILIIDEADRLFDMGFLPDITKILKKMPDSKNRLTLLFSATLNFQVRNLVWEFMTDPVDIELSPDQITVDKIKQSLIHLSKKEKIKYLLGILKNDNPGNIIIFTNTKQAAYEVSSRLNENGYNSIYIMGDLPQKKRLSIIKGVKNGEYPILVATDVAGRGLHIEDLELVINYDIPLDCENYVHRIGRTARVGKSGKSISFACEEYVYGLEAIESYIKMKIPVDFAEDNYFIEDSSSHKRFFLQKNKPSNTSHEFKGRKKTLHRKSPTNSKHSETRSNNNSSYQHRTDGKKLNNKFNSKPGSNYRNNYQKKNIDFTPTEEIRPDKSSGIEERVEYYRKKYGENFTFDKKIIKQEKKSKKKSKGFARRMFRFLKKK
jgi:ATP-dependent RNA helicase RhlB